MLRYLILMHINNEYIIYNYIYSNQYQMSLHGWFSAKAEEQACNLTKSEGIVCSIPVYLDAEGNHIQVTFVTIEKELDYLCQWDDLQYRGEVYKWSNEN